MQFYVAAIFLWTAFMLSDAMKIHSATFTNMKNVGCRMISRGKAAVIEQWSPSSWQSLPVQQPPNYQDQKKVDEVLVKLAKCSPLIFAGEVRTLQEQLARASAGQAFLLMGGDCAEAFSEFSVNHVRDTLRVLLQMSLIMTFGGSIPVVKVGRIAGQFAKPRSEPDEVRRNIFATLCEFDCLYYV